MSSPDRGQWAGSISQVRKPPTNSSAISTSRVLRTGREPSRRRNCTRYGASAGGSARAQLASGCGARSRRRVVSGRAMRLRSALDGPRLRGLSGQRVELGGELHLLRTTVQAGRQAVRPHWLGTSTGNRGRVYARSGAGGCASSHPGGTGRLLVRRTRRRAREPRVEAAARAPTRSPGRRSTWTPMARRCCRRGGGARRTARPTPRPWRGWPSARRPPGSRTPPRSPRACARGEPQGRQRPPLVPAGRLPRARPRLRQLFGGGRARPAPTAPGCAGSRAGSARAAPP